MVDSPIIALNRAIALSEASGPAPALALVDDLATTGALSSSHYLPSARGELLARMGRLTFARRQFLHAAELATNDMERRVLLSKAAALARSRAVEMP